jgi:ribosomal-protein-alanine N-acetyltransferase
MLLLPVIRLAEPPDAQAIALMSRGLIEQGLGWSWREARVHHAIAERSTNVAVLTEGAVLLGFGIMQYREEIAHLALFAIDPGRRRRGLGARLLAWLEQPARIAGIERVRLEARADNEAALAFYLEQGFRRVATVAGYYEGLVDAVKLEKRFMLAP